MQHRNKSVQSAKHPHKAAKTTTVRLVATPREPLEPAFSLYSPEAKRFPLILTLDQNGIPHRWITWQHAVWYYAKQRVAWETGSEAFTVCGVGSPGTELEFAL